MAAQEWLTSDFMGGPVEFLVHCWGVRGTGSEGGAPRWLVLHIFIQEILSSQPCVKHYSTLSCSLDTGCVAALRLRGVSWGLFSQIASVELLRKQNWAERRWTVIQSHHRSQPIPQGALELKWPLGIVQSWGNGARPLYPQTYKLLMWATSSEEM